MITPSYKHLKTENNVASNEAFHQASFGLMGCFIVSSSSGFDVYNDLKRFDVVSTADATGDANVVTCASGSVFTDVLEGNYVKFVDASGCVRLQSYIKPDGVDASAKTLTVDDPLDALGTLSGGRIDVASFAGTVGFQVLEDVTSLSVTENIKWGDSYPTSLSAGTFVYGDFTSISVGGGKIKVYLR